jgi:hypothetical protein
MLASRESIIKILSLTRSALPNHFPPFRGHTSLPQCSEIDLAVKETCVQALAMVALLFFIGILTPIILSAPDSFLTRHRSILPTVSTKRSTPQKWIVHLWPNCSHHHFATRLADHHRLAVSPPKITHEYHHVLHGLTVQDVEESALKLLPCIKFYEKDSVKRLVSVPSWGIDRLDQKDLPLDNSYQSTYSGANVDGTPHPSTSL